MSKKLVIPTLETQQKYPLFYAEATKTINDIIEHISKERGIYTSNIEPDPKEHLIWFNTNFNAIYFYNEKTKSFIPITGGGGGDLSTIITLVNDLREEIGDYDAWENEGQYNTIYKALDGLQTQIQNINSTIIPIYTVYDKDELFDMDLKRGIYKVVEEYNDKAIVIKNYYILTVGGHPSSLTYKLYGNTGIFEQQTIDGVKQFVKVDFNAGNISEIVGSGKFGSNLEDASNITDAINILSSIIGETDSGDAELGFMNGYSILTYLAYIDDIFDINSISLLVGHDEQSRKFAKIFTDLQTLVNNLKTLVGEGGWNLGNFPNGDNLSICVDELGHAVGSVEDWNNTKRYGNVFEALDGIVTEIENIKDNINNNTGGSSILDKHRIDILREYLLDKNFITYDNMFGGDGFTATNNGKYKIINRNEIDIVANSTSKFEILSIYSSLFTINGHYPDVTDDIEDKIVLYIYNNGTIEKTIILLDENEVFSTGPIDVYNDNKGDIMGIEFSEYTDNGYIYNIQNPDYYIVLLENTNSIIVPPNKYILDVPDSIYLNTIMMFGGYRSLDYIPYGGDYINIDNCIAYTNINMLTSYIHHLVVNTTYSEYSPECVQLQRFTDDDADKSSVFIQNNVSITNCSSDIDSYVIETGGDTPTKIAYFGYNTTVSIVIMAAKNIIRIFESVPEFLNITCSDGDELSQLTIYTTTELMQTLKNKITDDNPGIDIDSINFIACSFEERTNELFSETVALDSNKTIIAKYINV